MLALRCADAGAFRTRRLGYAVATSLGCKVSTTCLQLVAMPIAIRALGTEQFALYATLAAMMGWISAINLGVGPALVARMAAAAARGDRAGALRLFTSAALPAALIAAAAGILALFLLLFLPITSLLGGNYPHHHAAARAGLVLLAAASLAQALLAVVEAAQAGYQEQYVFNLWSMAGSGLTAAAVACVACFFPSVPAFIAAMAMAPLAARFANAVGFLRRNAYLLPRWRSFDPAECRSVMGSGIAFWLVGGCAAFLLHQLPVALVGRTLPPHSAASFAASVNAMLIGFGMVSMVTLPLWPAMADSLTFGDGAWIGKAHRRVLFFTTGYACAVCAVLSAAGPSLLRLWLGSSIQPGAPLLTGIGVYFVFLVWEHTHYMLMAGMQYIWTPSLLIVARAALTALAMPWAMRRLGEAGPAVALAVFALLLTAWSFPLLYRKSLQSAKSAASSRADTKLHCGARAARC